MTLIRPILALILSAYLAPKLKSLGLNVDPDTQTMLIAGLAAFISIAFHLITGSPQFASLVKRALTESPADVAILRQVSPEVAIFIARAVRAELDVKRPLDKPQPEKTT